MYQTTIASQFSFSGVGLHSGNTMLVKVSPADVDTGLLFCRTDVMNCPIVRATPFNVTSTQLATTITCGDFPISTIEHLVSALHGLGVDNACIEVGGAEIPILDGSAEPIVELIASAGIIPQDAKRKYLKIERDVELERDEKLVQGTPGDSFGIIFEIEYSHEAIKKQVSQLDMSPELYKRTVANSRTFGFRKDVEMLRQMGLAKGGSLENAIVLDEEEGIMNPEGLRHKDEFVNHKILDMVGDLSLVGYRIYGCLHAVKSGHLVNNLFARKLLESVSAYSLVEVDGELQGYGYLNCGK